MKSCIHRSETEEGIQSGTQRKACKIKFNSNKVSEEVVVGQNDVVERVPLRKW